ncbi:LOW QUALITY PROTEIN: glutamine-rich protein 2 [Microcaecilia unicolor]|uniref:LOW QUALITY PROTEIN: glutamine-rich protein 2 n=1 Tax=Microcaecilia unicolor TaxID=1415580 RepID=A0A6P7YLZ3_9AMPH|nr:LOW QUALITY PROTEIN: glutamine-rich protein 2 [Microcaecilia unicolor]
MPCMVTLNELANLSIGTPELGVVNFNALHALIHAIIRHLKIQDVKTEISEDEKDFIKPLISVPSQVKEEDKVEAGELIRVPIGYEQLDRKISDIAKQIDALNKWPTAADLLERSKEVPSGSPVGELWHMMQMKRKIELNADGISKAMTLLQDLVNEINTLKQFQDRKENDIQMMMKEFLPEHPGELQRQRDELENQRMELDNMQLFLQELDEKLKLYPAPNEVNNMVRWEILQETLLPGSTKKDMQTTDDLSAEAEDASYPSKPTLHSARKTQSSSSSQALQSKPSRAHLTASVTSAKTVGQPSAKGSPAGLGPQQPSKGAPARQGAQQTTETGAQQSSTAAPTGPGAQLLPTGTPGGPGAQSMATGPQFGPAAQQTVTGIPDGSGAQQLPMGTLDTAEAHQLAMGTPAGPGAQQLAMGAPAGPGAPQLAMGAPAGPEAPHLAMGTPAGPGAPQLATATPAGPGTQQLVMGAPAGPGTAAGPGAQQLVMGTPAGQGAQQLAMGTPTGSGGQQLATGTPMTPVDEQFDTGSVTEPEAQLSAGLSPTGPGAQPSSRLSPTGPGFQPSVRISPTGPGAQPPARGGPVGPGAQLSDVGSPGGPGAPQFAPVYPAESAAPSSTMGMHEAMPSVPGPHEVQPQIQEGSQTVEHSTKPAPGSPAPSTFHSKSRSPGSRAASSASSRLSSAAVRYVETVETLRQIGQVAKLYGGLKEQVEELYIIKADRTELFQLPMLQGLQGLQGIQSLQGFQSLQGLQGLQNLQGLPIPETDIPRLTTDVLEQLASLKDLKEDMQENKQMDGELQKHVQEVILQLQDECEKLNSTTRHLIDDHNEKQKQIDLLYQSLEKLDMKKADKEQMDIEFDSKATKNALESKVSRTQFDTTAEQLNLMIQELLNKVTGQEQDWQKVVDKISNEMETKLDRMELDPFRKQLEDRWKSIRKQLKDRSPTYELDDAAGIRKQLIARFHCISCDRPVDMAVPGPQILTIPNVPGLPGHRSSRPYTVYELEQVRQHSRNMKSGITYARYEAVQMEKSINQLRRLHTCLRKEIEKVQAHFGGSMRASTQTIREMLQSRCLGLGQHRKRLDSKPMSDRIVPEVMDHTYLSNRSCGGSHTLTFPHRRYSRLQNINQYNSPGEEENVTSVVKGEVGILGLDGQIYKGRLDHRFPTIGVKETMQSKIKLKHQTPPKVLTPIDPNSLPSRSQSAKMSCRSQSSSGLGKSGKDRPLTSQTNNLPGSQLVDNLEVRIDVPMNRMSSEETAM